MLSLRHTNGFANSLVSWLPPACSNPRTPSACLIASKPGCIFPSNITKASIRHANQPILLIIGGIMDFCIINNSSLSGPPVGKDIHLSSVLLGSYSYDLCKNPISGKKYLPSHYQLHRLIDLRTLVPSFRPSTKKACTSFLPTPWPCVVRSTAIDIKVPHLSAGSA